MWSQYLEVGIGPDAEVFTKAPVLSSVGTDAEIGIHPGSSWNNPEPEVVLAVNSKGEVKGATLGNDVNLRDFEGRSALLLSKAKDNNGLRHRPVHPRVRRQWAGGCAMHDARDRHRCADGLVQASTPNAPRSSRRIRPTPINSRWLHE